MKKWRALTTGVLSIAMMLSASTGVFANDAVLSDAQADAAIEEPIMGVIQQKFVPFSGTISEVRPFYDADQKEVPGNYYVLVDADKESAEDWGAQVNFAINEHTYMLNDNELKVGSKFVGYYDQSAPMLMIYPPQLTAVVAGVDVEEKSTIKIAYFDENGVSADNELKILNTDKAEIILQNGEKFDGDLTNRLLVVFYDISTKSLPPQTSPKKIVVLFERAEHPIYEMPTGGLILDGSDAAETPQLPTTPGEAPVVTDVAKMPIVVDGTTIEASAYDKNGVTMVPIAPIVSAMGYEAVWDSETKTITMGRTVSMTVGENAYNFARMAPIALESAPEIVDGRAYVPLSFFSKVFQVEGGAIKDGVIEISGKEVGTAE